MDWDRLRSMSDAEREAIAEADTDNPLWTVESFREASYVHPSGEACVPFVSHLPPDAMEYYTSMGEGYQERISQDLQHLYVTRQRRNSRRGKTEVRSSLVSFSGKLWDGQEGSSEHTAPDGT